jgi:hypothetical protein
MKYVTAMCVLLSSASAMAQPNYGMPPQTTQTGSGVGAGDGSAAATLRTGMPSQLYQPQPIYGSTDYSELYGTGTVFGSILRGQAAVIRAEGEYNQRSADALVRLGQAQREFLENRIRGVQAYFDIRP